jgi:TetR/AcrR family transcriptional regulator
MDNRQNILDCAMGLFARQGYDAVGVQEIVEAAGITKPTLYHYFGSKNGLLKALLERGCSPMLESIRAAAAYQGDLPLTLRKVAGAYFTFAEQNPAFYRLMLGLWFAPQDSEGFQMVKDWNASQNQVLETMFNLAERDHGNMRGRQRIYAASYLGLVNTCVMLILNGYVDVKEPFVDRIIHQFEHGIYS